MGRLSKGIRNTLRLMAGIYLLLNLCVATIPRCDSILTVLQHTLKNRDWATLAHHHAMSETRGQTRLGCHDQEPCASAQISGDRLCECSLVKFVFVTLPSFDPRRFIAFRIQTTTLIQFDIPLWNPAAQKGPEPPYPRWHLV